MAYVTFMKLGRKRAPPKGSGVIKPKKRGGVQPNQHVPNDETRLRVTLLKMQGVVREGIARQFGISADTLEKHYAYELEHGEDALINEAASKVVEHWRNGDKTMLCFFMKTRARWRETDQRDYRNLPGHGDDRSEASATRLVLQIIGGLPQGSTPENPGGDNYSEVPPEETNG
ncbi:MAG: helix-turn-helix domain-containing protein [Alphaproteobacteria bacterium]|nr:helix-turn-helix domain-containing protein [Alphaproteobacteria bacterium]